MNDLWSVGSLAFFVGTLCGALIYHFLLGSRFRSSRLESQLDEVQQGFKEYQERVGDHFNTSAHLINKLTDAYRDFHQHVANGAEDLCKDEEVRNRLGDSLLSGSTLLSGKIHKRRNERTPPLEQPKDYVPKSSAD